MATTYTTNMSLSLQAFDDPAWDVELRRNFNILDARLGAIFSTGAASGQVLASAGSGGVPAFTPNPAIGALTVTSLIANNSGVALAVFGSQATYRPLMFTYTDSAAGNVQFALSGTRTGVAASNSAFVDATWGFNYNPSGQTSGQPRWAYSFESNWGTASGTSQSEIYWDYTPYQTYSGSPQWRPWAVTMGLQTHLCRIDNLVGGGSGARFNIGWAALSSSVIPTSVQHADVFTFDPASAGGADFSRRLRVLAQPNQFIVINTSDLSSTFYNRFAVGVGETASYSSVTIDANRIVTATDNNSAGGILTITGRAVAIAAAMAGESTGLVIKGPFGDNTGPVGLTRMNSYLTFRLVNASASDDSRDWTFDTANIAVPNNVGIGTQSWGLNAANVLGIAEGTRPQSSPANVGQVFVESGHLKYRGPAGTVTVVACT